ncbi:MAG: FAD-binding oxidoreductase [Candidatus Acidiferrales bacterium]
MTIAPQSLARQLADICGPANTMEDPGELARYQIGEMRPLVAARPASSEETVEIVKLAEGEGLALVACGARTKLGMGMPPRKYDLALDLARLNRVIAYDPGDLTLSVEAGISLAALDGELRKHSQFLPQAVPFFRSATVGGTVASGVDTPLRQFYGTARDYVLGMEFITGTGVLTKSGGRVVKNVTGYDLHKLMIGAMGTLGIITKINFRTFPLALEPRTFIASFADAPGALALRNLIADSPLRPLSLDILSPGIAQVFSGTTAAQIEPAPPPMEVMSGANWQLAAQFAGNEGIRARYESEFERMTHEAGGVRVASVSMLEMDGLAGRIREFVPIALGNSSATTVVKIGVLPSRTHEMLASCARAAEENNLRWAAVARGVGIILAALLPDARNEESAGRAQRATEQIAESTAALGGNMTIPWCPGEWKHRMKIWGIDRNDFAQMKKLKQFFDPHGTLSPGRFVGGL